MGIVNEKLFFVIILTFFISLSIIKMRDSNHADISNDYMLEYIQPNPLKIGHKAYRFFYNNLRNISLFLDNIDTKIV